MAKFSRTSERRLVTCHPQLQLVAREAIKTYDFLVVSGHRGQAEQDRCFREGTSKLQYPYSKHNAEPSLAMDLAPWPLDWDDREEFFYLGGVIMTVAEGLGVRLIWGGRWLMGDLPHFEMPGVNTV